MYTKDSGQRGYPIANGSETQLDREHLRTIAAELAAALGQIDLSHLDADTAARLDRARTVSRRLTRLVGSDDPDDGEADAFPGDLPDLVGYRAFLAVEGSELQLMLGRLLAEMGARYELARDGNEALALLAETTFDLAVVDDDLAPEGGRDLIAAIRAMPDGKGRIPVIAICPEGTEASQHALGQAGADLLLTASTLTPARFARAIAAIATELSEPAPLPDTLLLDGERYRRLLEIAGDGGALELLERLLEDLRQVQQGLTRALADPNPAEVRTQTHVLIALAGAVGADALQRLTDSLNSAAHRRAPEDMTALGRQVLRQLSQLVQFIAEEEAETRSRQ